MLNTQTWNLVNHASNLTDIRDRMKARYHAAINVGVGSVEYSADDRISIAVINGVMRPWMLAHHLTASLDRLDRVVEYSKDSDCHIDDLADKITALLEALEDELKRKMFFYLPSEYADLINLLACLVAFGMACYYAKEFDWLKLGACLLGMLLSAASIEHLVHQSYNARHATCPHCDDDDSDRPDNDPF